MRSHAQSTGVCVLLAVPAIAAANDFPTQARVEFVLGCMNEQGGQSYDTLYKCVCLVDAIAAEMTHEEFAQAQVFSQLRSTAGERGGVFRDPDSGATRSSRSSRPSSSAARRSASIRKLAQSQTEAHTLADRLSDSWSKTRPSPTIRRAGMTTKRFVDLLALVLPRFAGANEQLKTAHRRLEQLGHVGRQLRRHALQQARPRSTRATSATCRSRGRSPRACCAVTKAVRSSSATRSTSTRRFRTRSIRSTWPIRRSTGRTRRRRTPTRFPVMCCDTVNRGLAFGDGKIFLQQADTKLVALECRRPAQSCGRSRTATRERRDQHERAARREGQSHHGHQRRRVRRARLRRRLRHRDRPPGLESLQRRPRQRDARRSRAARRISAGRSARTRA